MANSTYRPVRDDSHGYLKTSRQSRTSVAASSSIIADKYGVGLGRPDSKPMFYTTDLLALAISFTCFVCAVCVITPKLTFSWQLGSELQIVILGFLLGIMSLCTQTVLPTLLLVIEARFGKSRLQNYQAILTSRFLSSHISLVWRFVLFVFVVLPIGLGVAYKRFFGGVSTISIRSVIFQNPMYGLAYPSLGDYSRMNNSVYELMSCNAGLWNIFYNDSLVPKSEDYPVALGYNMVLLDSGAAALLDMPSQGYLDWIQANLRTNETWEVSASVNATVARNNETLAKRLRSDDEYFNDTYYALYPYTYWTFTSFYTYTHDRNLGMFPIIVNNATDAACMLGFYDSPSGAGRPAAFFIDIDEADVQPFRTNASVFSLTRERCTARWRIAKGEVALLRGKCDPETSREISQYMLDYAPYSLDTLPVLVHSLQDFRDVRSQSPWRLPTYASAVASSYWARAAFMLAETNDGLKFPDLFYPPQGEQIRSSIATLHASWLLYVVLSVQPFLTITAVILIACFHSTPVSRGFGLVSVLAGINPVGLHVLRGAALSGETAESVILKARVRARNVFATTETGRQPYRHYVEYSVLSESEDDGIPETHIERKEVYE